MVSRSIKTPICAIFTSKEVTTRETEPDGDYTKEYNHP